MRIAACRGKSPSHLRDSIKRLQETYKGSRIFDHGKRVLLEPRLHFGLAARGVEIVSCLQTVQLGIDSLPIWKPLKKRKREEMRAIKDRRKALYRTEQTRRSLPMTRMVSLATMKSEMSCEYSRITK